MNAIWQLWEAGLSNEVCNKIIKEAESYEVEDATIGSVNSKKNKQIRQSTVRWVNSTNETSRFIHNILWSYASAANKNAFGLDINLLDQIQYTIYDGTKEDFYGFHYDTFWANPTMYDRKISVTVQLSDPEDYEGGEFLFEPQFIQPEQKKLKKQGSILVFPSMIGHCVKPVTKGTRKSLVAWVEGPKFR
jgi:PKHD-type hydroxylase